MDPVDFLLSDAPLPDQVIAQARRCLLDLVGVGWGGAALPLSRIARDHAAEDLGGAVPLPFDTRRAGSMGVALATGMTIDALDGHDGANLTKGHAGCGVLAGLIAVAPDEMPAAPFLDLLARGYEVAIRAGIVQHATCPDYHTSGAWVAVAVAGLAGRMLGLDRAAMAHALGIAEYHGPRSQMMRVIDHPTMLKDGSGQGAMIGVQAAQLAARGFTGAPALVAQGAGWDDLGTRWMIHEQYFKPYPVCRWAQPCVEAALSLRPALSGPIERVVIETFHESLRLAVARPMTTEEAQYSTAFPVAVALARGRVGPSDVSGAALTDPAILALADRIDFRESAEANAVFPAIRQARARITAGGQTHLSDWHRPRWDAEAPPTDAELAAKFDETAAGAPRPAPSIRAAVERFAHVGALRRAMRC
ncbi:MmgE/PrpD family protein [Jannaschia seohaensis]|uniref:2-methylcitrate dehydratase PrpD n=1 Tax=Jannaschia seohaensis TaxID=475081 RepID=A0A2Y9C907_9RHOB|nr:MmgE/PrpD family protein [Jannaschia seohaensis]PWJ12452.1 2-methylcitrate dehydratase PrpD [Jannaschia seohaensis]SSA50933.1 2-methylcitrate dehydratase PrpD [Jannaschia seohaensis]